MVVSFFFPGEGRRKIIPVSSFSFWLYTIAYHWIYFFYFSLQLRIDVPFSKITRKHSRRMRTSRFSGCGGGGPNLPCRQAPTTVRRSPCRQTPSPVNRMTGTCKNITLPQNTFAGGNNTKFTFDDFGLVSAFLALAAAPWAWWIRSVTNKT